jgi:hypothetical protein
MHCHGFFLRNDPQCDGPRDLQFAAISTSNQSFPGLYPPVATGRVIIMPGGGVSPETVEAIANGTGATEFHSSAGTTIPSPVRFRKEGIAMGVINGANLIDSRQVKRTSAHSCGRSVALLRKGFQRGVFE